MESVPPMNRILKFPLIGGLNGLLMVFWHEFLIRRMVGMFSFVLPAPFCWGDYYDYGVMVMIRCYDDEINNWVWFHTKKMSYERSPSPLVSQVSTHSQLAINMACCQTEPQ